MARNGAQHSPKQVTPPAPLRSTSPRVLIVDDDRLSRDRVAGWFRCAGWNVQVATTCAEALGIAAVALPGCGIVEQRLADGSGLDLFPRLRALSPDLDCVVFTRYPSIAGAVHAIRLGFRDYLAKPATREVVSALFGIAPSPPIAAAVPPANDTAEEIPECQSLARVEWEHIQSVLFACCGNVSQAARLLGVHRRSLQRKLRRIAPG